LDEKGQVIGKSAPLVGDSVDAVVKWAMDPQIGRDLIRLRFDIKNADVFSLRFR
jgi:hypothetical protein